MPSVGNALAIPIAFSRTTGRRLFMDDRNETVVQGTAARIARSERKTKRQPKPSGRKLVDAGQHRASLPPAAHRGPACWAFREHQSLVRDPALAGRRFCPKAVFAESPVERRCSRSIYHPAGWRHDRDRSRKPASHESRSRCGAGSRALDAYQSGGKPLHYAPYAPAPRMPPRLPPARERQTVARTGVLFRAPVTEVIHEIDHRA